MKTDRSLLRRFRRWLAWGIGLAVVFYVLFSAWIGLGPVLETLGAFSWVYYLPAVLLTLLNYCLRFGKWHYLLGRLGIQIDWKEDFLIFCAGLAMVISPGKVGEVLKPYLVRVRTGVPMATTLPVLITERLTDGIACLSLAALGVGTYMAESAIYLIVPLGMIAVLLLVLSNIRFSLWIIRLLGRLPLISRFTPKLEELYGAMRTCVAPVPLVVTVAMSMVAWGGECLGYQLIFDGFGLDVPLSQATFMYAFATVAGGAVPGGLGVADGALQALANGLVVGITPAQALAAAMLIRLATLWMGELIGAVALFRVGDLLEEEE